MAVEGLFDIFGDLIVEWCDANVDSVVKGASGKVVAFFGGEIVPFSRFLDAGEGRIGNTVEFFLLSTNFMTGGGFNSRHRLSFR